jgi:NlpC/P60 family protein
MCVPFIYDLAIFLVQTFDCEGGRTTVDDCMERGLGVKGYDCSGLVITSLCRVLGIETEEWPREYRHSYQLKPFGESRDPEFGDILLIDSQADDGYQYNTDMGLHVASRHVIHANGKTRVVDEGEVMGTITGIKTVDMSALASALGAHIKSLK